MLPIEPVFKRIAKLFSDDNHDACVSLPSVDDHFVQLSSRRPRLSALSLLNSEHNALHRMSHSQKVSDMADSDDGCKLQGFEMHNGFLLPGAQFVSTKTNIC